jgi:hypothetical protein
VRAPPQRKPKEPKKTQKGIFKVFQIGAPPRRKREKEKFWKKSEFL